MKADTHRDGIISAQELQSSGMQISVLGNTTFVGTQEEIDSFRVSEEFWQTVDPNDSGTVTRNELNNSGLMLNLNANERNIVDTNKDGQLSVEEYQNMFNILNQNQ